MENGYNSNGTLKREPHEKERKTPVSYMSGANGMGRGSKKRKRGGVDRSVFQSLALVTQFGIHMIVPIFLCTFLGICIDEKAGTSFWVIILFFMGALAGFTNIYKLAKKINGTKRNDKK